LGAAQVALGRLHGNVAKEKLYLLQLAASGTAEPSTTPPEIVWRELVHTNLRRELLNDVPDELLRNLFAPDFPGATHAPEKATASDSSGGHLLIQEIPHPLGDGHGPNVTSLPTQINDCPMTFTLLEVIHGQDSELVPPESASQEDGE
jgi:hypothetical protein